MSVPVTIDGATVQLSPVGAYALHHTLAHEQRPDIVADACPRPSCRDRLVSLGLATVHPHGHIELTATGRTVTNQLDRETAR